MSAARSPRRAWLRRAALVAALLLAVLAVLVGRPALFLARVAWNDERGVPAPVPGHVDDRSGQESTAVLEVRSVPDDPDEALAVLRALLADAARAQLPVSIAGSRHSMGGHTIAPGGVVIDMTGFDGMELEAAASGAGEPDTLRVGCGATWAQVLAYLDPLGRSVAIMQSNDSFTVGGSLSVNCHGWQHGSPPIASSVRSFRILLADGSLVACSREENRELFGLALGGYGLFGVLIDARLAVVDNELYRTETTVLASRDLGESFLAEAGGDDVGLALGRVGIEPGALFEESILRLYRRVAADGPLPPIAPSLHRGLRRTVFRGSIGSDYGKELRWFLETRLGALAAGGTTTRNAALSEPVDVYANSDAAGVDILHEYFVPHARLAEFLDAARPLCAASECDLLNVTVRDVRADVDSVLRYADQDLFAVVMLFHQELRPGTDEAMRALTSALIDAAHRHGGRYYLPYRLHATRAQFERAYPMARAFFEAKRRYDPQLRFQNRFWLTYGA